MNLRVYDPAILVEIPSIDKAPAEFRQAVQAALGHDPGEIVADGNYHRFRSPEDGDRPLSSCACFYKLDLVTLFGLAGDFRRDPKPLLYWEARRAGDTRSQEEREAQRAEFRQQHEAQRKLEWEEAKRRSRAVWDAASPELGEHRYLVSHGVLEDARAIAGQCVRVHLASKKLIVPMLDENEKLWNRQAISGDGEKRFLYGGRTEGLAVWVPAAPTPEQTWYAVEGFAKAVAVWSATERPTLCCFSAGNMLAAIKARQARVDLSKLTIAADNDSSGRKAVEQVRTLYPVSAVFPEREGMDWNDILVKWGMAGLRSALTGASGGKLDVIEPEPLFRELLPAEPYPVEALGDILAPAAEALIRVFRVPVALAAQAVLATAALCAQPFVNVIIDGRVYPLSLFFITIAESGERKSAVDNTAQVPINERQRYLAAKYRDEKAVHRRELQEFDRMERDAMKGKVADLNKIKEARDRKKEALDALGEPPAAPLLPNIKASDPTAEGLYKAFAQGQPSMGLFADEGGLFVGGHALMKEARIRTIAALSWLWDGHPLDRVRGGDGASLLFDRRLSLHLMMQPLVAAELLNDPIYDSQGFFARILCSWPESTAGTRRYVAQDITQDPAIHEYWKRLTALLTKPFPLQEGTQNELRPRNVPLSAEAKDRWVDYYNVIEFQQGDNQPLQPIKGFASKAAEHAARIAGVLAVLESPDTVVIGLKHVQSGIDLLDYYITEALRIKDGGAVPPELKQAAKLLEWAQPRQFVYPTQLYKSGPNSIRTREIAMKAINILVKHRWLLPVEGGMELDGAHRREVWRVVKGSER